ncbi:unnamed protein product [Toxocara canis]|uniref:DUF3694 domain-containing protein n=1 Tax=Toxocara canis TaxID=6265 RepID=A0A183UWU2_TOXCA|nr:unnamed protein product [Toxocara canis]
MAVFEGWYRSSFHGQNIHGRPEYAMGMSVENSNYSAIGFQQNRGVQKVTIVPKWRVACDIEPVARSVALDHLFENTLCLGQYQLDFPINSTDRRDVRGRGSNDGGVRIYALLRIMPFLPGVPTEALLVTGEFAVVASVVEVSLWPSAILHSGIKMKERLDPTAELFEFEFWVIPPFRVERGCECLHFLCCGCHISKEALHRSMDDRAKLGHVMTSVNSPLIIARKFAIVPRFSGMWESHLVESCSGRDSIFGGASNLSSSMAVSSSSPRLSSSEAPTCSVLDERRQRELDTISNEEMLVPPVHDDQACYLFHIVYLQ